MTSSLIKNCSYKDGHARDLPIVWKTIVGNINVTTKGLLNSLEKKSIYYIFLLTCFVCDSTVQWQRGQCKVEERNLL